MTEDTDINITGDGNVYFDDPIEAAGAGSILTKGGAGFIQFKGANTLNGSAQINEGGDSVTLSSGEDINFSGLNSLRLRIGTEYSKPINPLTTINLGIAY